MYQGEVIDAHMHLWDLANDYQWLNQTLPDFEQLIGNYERIQHNFLPKDYQRMVHGHNVVKTIHLQAFGFPDNPVAETRWLQQQADHYGFPQGIVAFANLADPQIATILEQHAKFPNVRGIRMPLNYHETPFRRMADRDDYLRDYQWQKGFALLSQYDLSFDVQIYDHQLEDVATLAKAFPNITIIIEHLAWPIDLSANGFELWKKRIAGIKDIRNIFMKLSGIGCVFQKAINEKQIHNYLDVAVNTLGAERCMFGSNCPPDSLFYTFTELLACYKKALMKYSLEEQYQIFYLTAKNAYRL